ncbi:MAG: hypothetical protein J7500_06975 [Sphingomonas sp.]|uniref:hypothetical protein n=1 Tax=Sphingomonas sp. TaxID=28214 RepID=UPI001B205FD3|nr:hypothetical protein [Sphingomonas sp.]MBO9622437.1 hypothetical protein [Sphingomonas sp.]
MNADSSFAAGLRRAPPSELCRDWSFVPSSPTLLSRLSRAKSFLMGFRPAPPYRALLPVTRRSRWNCYFLYLPDGQLTPAHRFTLKQLRALPGGLLAIAAAPRAEDLAVLEGSADALYWKGLRGFDFSAYSLALAEVAGRSPGADLLVMNDSVLGPFGDIEAAIARSPWDLTGFTASWLFENHLQSYAFHLREVTPERIRAFGSAIPQRVSLDSYRNVINVQETRFARLAARRMRVGAMWYAKGPALHDPSLQCALDLAEAGFPFVKRSLLGRYSHFQDREAIEALLASHGHPVPR